MLWTSGASLLEYASPLLQPVPSQAVAWRDKRQVDWKSVYPKNAVKPRPSGLGIKVYLRSKAGFRTY